MRADKNELVTRIGPGTPCGNLLRQYWQPIALLDEFDPSLDAAMGRRPVKALTILGQEFVLFRDESGKFGLLGRACPHRGADLAFGRFEGDGLRCPFHGWKFAADGTCLETPGEPQPPQGQAPFCTRIRQASYPLEIKAGVIWAWFGTGEAPAFPAWDCFTAPNTHSFSFKGMWHANWLQCVEVGIDPAHPSFLHRYFGDASLDDTYGKQFRAASAGDVDGERWPMSRIMRECQSPDIQFEAKPWGFEIKTLRHINDKKTHVRVTQSIFPQTFVIPLSETMTITQWHLPIDDTHTYWYSIFTSFAEPMDKTAMRNQRLRGNPGPAFIPIMGKHNQWGYNPEEQRTNTYLGMGEDDINVHDQWAVESMGAIQDRTKEHLGTTDKVIIANRRLLMNAIDSLGSGQTAAQALPAQVLPAQFTKEQASQLTGPDTIDGIAPANAVESFWREGTQAKRAKATWVKPRHVTST